MTARPPITSVDVAHLLGAPSNVAWRWLRTIGHERQAWTWPTADITEREAVALYAGRHYGRTELGRTIARAIARTDYSWLFVRVGCVLGAESAADLLRMWRKVDTPTGVVLNLDRLTSEMRAHLEPDHVSPTMTKEAP